MSSFFVIVAVAAAAALFVLALRLVMAPSSQASVSQEPLPLTPLQRRAWAALGIGAGVLLVAVAIVINRGLAASLEDPGTRFLIYALLLLALMSHLWIVWFSRGEQTDERDRIILNGAPALQSVAVLVTLVAWSVGLTEAYQGVGSIPAVFPTLIFVSCVVVSSVSLFAAILLGYRRTRYHAEG